MSLDVLNTRYSILETRKRRYCGKDFSNSKITENPQICGEAQESLPPLWPTPGLRALF